MNVEGVIDGGMHAEEPLRRTSRFEALHLPLATSDDKMRVFGTIVRPETLLVASTEPEILEGRSIGSELIGLHDPRPPVRTLATAQWLPKRRSCTARCGDVALSSSDNGIEICRSA